MASFDNSTVWAQGVVTAGRASEARGAGDGAALAILSEGEEAYGNLYDSRDDSKFSTTSPRGCPTRLQAALSFFLAHGCTMNTSGRNVPLG